VLRVVFGVQCRLPELPLLAGWIGQGDHRLPEFGAGSHCPEAKVKLVRHFGEPAAWVADWYYPICSVAWLIGATRLGPRLTRRWSKVTCKRCLAMAPKHVRARLASQGTDVSVVHHDSWRYGGSFRAATCGGLHGRHQTARIVRSWATVTCKRCLRMAPKRVKARLSLP
jgi:RNase P subunit RPR2